MVTNKISALFLVNNQMSGQVTFISITFYTIQIVSKKHYNDNRKIQ